MVPLLLSSLFMTPKKRHFTCSGLHFFGVVLLFSVLVMAPFLAHSNDDFEMDLPSEEVADIILVPSDMRAHFNAMGTPEKATDLKYQEANHACIAYGFSKSVWAEGEESYEEYFSTVSKKDTNRILKRKHFPLAEPFVYRPTVFTGSVESVIENTASLRKGLFVEVFLPTTIMLAARGAIDYLTGQHFSLWSPIIKEDGSSNGKIFHSLDVDFLPSTLAVKNYLVVPLFENYVSKMRFNLSSLFPQLIKKKSTPWYNERVILDDGQNPKPRIANLRGKQIRCSGNREKVKKQDWYKQRHNPEIVIGNIIQDYLNQGVNLEIGTDLDLCGSGPWAGREAVSLMRKLVPILKDKAE